MNSYLYLSKTASMVCKDLPARRFFFPSQRFFSAATCKATTTTTRDSDCIKKNQYQRRTIMTAVAGTRYSAATKFHRTKSFQRKASIANTTTNNNSTTTTKTGSSSSFSTLSEILQREITEEAQNPLNEMPTELSELKTTLSQHWTILDGKAASSSDGALVKMFKNENANGAKVSLTFHCQDSLNAEELSFLESAASAASDVVGAEPGNGEDDDEEGEEPSTPVKFDVMISRSGKTMHISCTSENAEVSIDGISIAPSDESQSQSQSSSSSSDDGDLYRGPMLEDLPESVLDAFEEYLEDVCGVNEDVAAFIAMYADYREQAEYINWLKGVKGIID